MTTLLKGQDMDSRASVNEPSPSRPRNARSRFLKLAGVIGLCSTCLTGCGSTIVGWVVRDQQMAGIPVSDNAQLITVDGDRFGVRDVEEVLAPANTNWSINPTHITLVHGMGPYPAKAFHDDAFSILQRDHDADVVLFSWPSWVDFRTLPNVNAEASGQKLLDYSKALSATLQRKQPDLETRNRTLLVHSMGAQVLKGMLERYDGGLPEDLYNAVVLIAPEVELQGHADWIERIDFARHVYVLVNEDDWVLEAPIILYGRQRLGTSLTTADGRAERLAQNAIYIHTEEGAYRHSYHLRDRSPEMVDLLAALVTPGKVAYDMDRLVPMSRPNVFSLPPTAD